MENMNSPMSIKEIKFIVKIFLTKKISGADGSTGEFYQILKNEIIPIVHKFFLIRIEKILPNSFCEVSIKVLIQK